MDLFHTLAEKIGSPKRFTDAAMAFLVRISAALLAYGLHVLLARTIDLGEYGVYITMWTWLIIVNQIATFGFSESTIRFLPRYAHLGKHQWANGFLRTGFKAVFFGASLITFAGMFVLFHFGDAFPNEYFLPLFVIFVGLPFSALEVYLESVSRSFGWYLLTIIPTYVLRPVLIATGVLLSVSMGYTPDASMILAMALFVTSIIVIVLTLTIRKRVRAMFGGSVSVGLKKIWFVASLPLILTSAVDEIFAWSDILILGFMVPADQVSVYFAAQRSLSLAAFVQFAFMLVMVRDFSLANAMRDRKELQRRITGASSWTFWLTVPSVLVTLALGYPLLQLFGPEFVNGYSIMIVLGVGFIIRAAIGQAQDLLIVLGHQRANVAISTGCIAINVVLSILMVPSQGIWGAALAMTITLLIRSIAFTIVTQRIAGLWVLAGVPDIAFASFKRAKPLSRRKV